MSTRKNDRPFVKSLQTITEAFFAHAVIGENGARMVEVVEAFQSQLGPGVQRLLMAPAEIDG